MCGSSALPKNAWVPGFPIQRHVPYKKTCCERGLITMAAKARSISGTTWAAIGPRMGGVTARGHTKGSCGRWTGLRWPARACPPGTRELSPTHSVDRLPAAPVPLWHNVLRTLAVHPYRSPCDSCKETLVGLSGVRLVSVLATTSRPGPRSIRHIWVGSRWSAKKSPGNG